MKLGLNGEAEKAWGPLVGHSRGQRRQGLWDQIPSSPGLPSAGGWEAMTQALRAGVGGTWVCCALRAGGCRT